MGGRKWEKEKDKAGELTLTNFKNWNWPSKEPKKCTKKKRKKKIHARNQTMFNKPLNNLWLAFETQNVQHEQGNEAFREKT